MASNMLQIAASGVRAARAALDLTSQNIANAGSEGYVRRSLRLTELAVTSPSGRIGDLSLSGVWIGGVARHADMFRQAEVRRTGADAARGSAELAGLEGAESALDLAGLYPALTEFDAALRRLSADPVDPALRTAVLEAARGVTGAFALAARGLTQTGEGLRFEAADGVAEVSLVAGELARTNKELIRTAEGTSDRAVLLDQRDRLLERLSGQAGVTTQFAADQTVEVRIGGALLVQGQNAATLAMTAAADGTVSFTLDGAAVTLAAGALAGKAQALVAVRDSVAGLDALTDNFAAAANAAQTGGTALDGSAGQPLFTGSGAGGIALALTNGSQLATAPSGAPAGSRDPANLTALIAALDGAGIAGQADALLFGLSGRTAANRITGEALEAIASAAATALDQQAGVDLDQEAVNLVRYQQAFQASSKAIQVASDTIDTILALR